MCPRCRRLLEEYLPNITLSWRANRILFCRPCHLFFNTRKRDITCSLSEEERREILNSRPLPIGVNQA